MARGSFDEIINGMNDVDALKSFKNVEGARLLGELNKLTDELDAANNALKATDNAVEKGIKQAAINEATAKVAAKQADIAKLNQLADARLAQLGKSPAEIAGGSAANAAKSAQAAGNDASAAARETLKGNFITRNPGKTAIVAGVTLTATGIAIAAATRADESEKNPRTIIKVERADDSFLADKKKIKITFTPEIKILKTDAITISGSKTTPSIDGSGITILDAPSDSSFIMKVPKELTDMTAGGKIDVKTGFGPQFKDITGETINDAGEIVGEGAGAIADPLGEGLGGLFSGIFSGLGIWAWVILGVFILFLFKR